MAVAVDGQVELYRDCEFVRLGLDGHYKGHDESDGATLSVTLGSNEVHFSDGVHLLGERVYVVSRDLLEDMATGFTKTAYKYLNVNMVDGVLKLSTKEWTLDATGATVADAEAE